MIFQQCNRRMHEDHQAITRGKEIRSEPGRGWLANSPCSTRCLLVVIVVVVSHSLDCDRCACHGRTQGSPWSGRGFPVRWVWLWHWVWTTTNTATATTTATEARQQTDKVRESQTAGGGGGGRGRGACRTSTSAGISTSTSTRLGGGREFG